MRMKKIMIFEIIVIVMCLCGCKNNKKPSQSGTVDDDLKTTELAKPSNSSPLNTNPLDNLFISLSVFRNQEYFKSNSIGTAKANFLGINYTQNIEIVKQKAKDVTLLQQISRSLLKKTAEQKMIYENCAVIRSASKINKDIVEWEKSGSKVISTSEYLELYGYLPTYYTGYILNKKTILDYKVLKNVENEFTIYLELDPKMAAEDYKKDVKVNGGMNDYPNFYYCHLTVTMNDNWEVLLILIEEEYDASLSGLGKLKCTTSMEEYFAYLKEDISEKSYYDNYVS